MRNAQALIIFTHDRTTQARRNCNFNDPNPATQCADGGCNGGLVCDPHTGTVRTKLISRRLCTHRYVKGVPPATVAEFTLSGNGNLDYYDGTCGVPQCFLWLTFHFQSRWSMATTCPCVLTTIKGAISLIAPLILGPTVRLNRIPLVLEVTRSCFENRPRPAQRAI